MGLPRKKPAKQGLFACFLFTSIRRFSIIDTKTFLDQDVRCSERRTENRRRSMAAQRMTQTQLVRTLAEECEVNNKVARQMLETLSTLAVNEVKKNGVFVIPGLGRLVRVERKARTGRNPATGESIKIPAKKVVKFRVAKAAKDSIVPPKKK
jgi:DNA-binding protein HU-beta